MNCLKVSSSEGFGMSPLRAFGWNAPACFDMQSSGVQPPAAFNG